MMYLLNNFSDISYRLTVQRAKGHTGKVGTGTRDPYVGPRTQDP